MPKRIAAIRYASPAAVPANLKRVAVVTAGLPTHEATTVVSVGSPVAAGARGAQVVGAITYASDALVPAGIKKVRIG